ncbi:MAG: sulfatase-like hydrolase/transferase [Nanoarchaeota archaeon]|nr:sulfatase-like hydrolase/transferase [Nanoarchaeota archaeon]
MNRFTLLLIVSLTLLSSCSLSSQQDKLDLSCPDCNLIMINVELLRADAVGLLNNASTATPFIDSFFSDGIVFTDVSAPAGATYESLTAVFRGQEALERPYHVFEDRKPEPDAPLTLAQVLQKDGWETAYVNEGRNSGDEVFMDVGFEYYYDSPDQRSINPSLNEFDYVLDHKSRERELLETAGEYQRQYVQYHINQLHFPFFFRTEEVFPLQKNFSYIGMTPAFSADDNLTMVEYFYDRQELEFDPYQREYDENGSFFWANFSLEQPDGSSRKIYYDLVLEENRYWYDKKLEKLDADLKEVFSHINQTGFLNNSIIVLYANHGQSLGENNLFHHSLLFQTTVHVPLLIHHPKISEPIIVDTPVSLVDLTATLYDMLGVDHRTSGVSMVSLLEGQNYQRDAIYGRNVDTKYIREGDWKLIDWGSYVTLYNLRADPYEEMDRSTDYPALAQELEEKLAAKELELKSWQKR